MTSLTSFNPHSHFVRKRLLCPFCRWGTRPKGYLGNRPKGRGWICRSIRGELITLLCWVFQSMNMVLDPLWFLSTFCNFQCADTCTCYNNIQSHLKFILRYKSVGSQIVSNCKLQIMNCTILITVKTCRSSNMYSGMPIIIHALQVMLHTNHIVSIGMMVYLSKSCLIITVK